MCVRHVLSPIIFAQNIFFSFKICVVRRDDTIDEFVFIGCDGVFDVLSNRECGKMIRSIFADGERGKIFSLVIQYNL